MYEVNDKHLSSISLFVGTGECNAHCKGCAGVPLRKYAPKKDGIINTELITKTLKECYTQGARYLSISSSGEPTLSPLAITKTLQLIDDYSKEGLRFSPVNLYSNGIRIGEDDAFCDTYLLLWKNFGLTAIYVTVHHPDEKKNAKAYGVEIYPALETIISKIHHAGLQMRANLVLQKDTIYTAHDFSNVITTLLHKGVDYISAWPKRTLEDKIDSARAPLKSEMDSMALWIRKNNFNTVKLLREENKIVYNTGQKLTLFPDGTLSNSWCNR
ncbi:MAG: hypothetical protein WC916_05910 [Candidatus Woesearchaeota archaeon]